MKNRTDNILLAVFALSLAAYVSIIVYGSGTSLEMRLIFSFHAVPAFCLQLLLCRKVRRWVAAIPTLVLLGAAMWFTYGFFTTTGWDSLGYALFLAFSAAPVAGCALVWAAFGLGQLRQRRNIG